MSLRNTCIYIHETKNTRLGFAVSIYGGKVVTTKMLSNEKWLNKILPVHKMENYTTIKKKKVIENSLV